MRTVLFISSVALAWRVATGDVATGAGPGHDVATGAYNKEGLGGRTFGSFGTYENQCLADWLASYFRERWDGVAPSAATRRRKATVVELGCGIGNYARHLTELGVFASVNCSDGNPSISEVTGGLCQTRNLVEPQLDLPRGDFAYSFEVGEHIPKRFETQYLDNLDRANRYGLVLSWSNEKCSKEGQGQHVNCHTTSHVVATMAKRGYVHNATAQQHARTAVVKCGKTPWLRHTIMVFSREGSSSV